MYRSNTFRAELSLARSCEEGRSKGGTWDPDVWVLKVEANFSSREVHVLPTGKEMKERPAQNIKIRMWVPQTTMWSCFSLLILGPIFLLFFLVRFIHLYIDDERDI